ncbi:MAG: hypothetical protein M1344_03275 [Candidatus Thermoplasmatota archaeon]|nr:hypothetical protein [Candidatus Thermoplasmatota archaeon]
MTELQFPERKNLFTSVQAVLAAYNGTAVTVRQLYYRLVAGGIIPNNIRAYKNLGAALTDWRRSGNLPISAFSDRTRGMINSDFGWRTNQPKSWLKSTMTDAIRTAEGYWLAKWYGQSFKVTVMVEKQALEGPFQEACGNLDVDLAVCRGYPSLSFLREVSERIGKSDGRANVILYFGDLDPSGLNIPETVNRDLSGLFGMDLEFHRIALSHEQVREMDLIPAPVKTTDSRSARFIEQNGELVYELDAIEPSRLKEIIVSSVLEYFDEDIEAEKEEKEREGRDEIRSILDKSGIRKLLGGL